MTANNPDRRPHVIIIGGGFGGLAAARALRAAPVRVTLLDRENHHTFQPLLYQVATAGLAPSDITVPIRWRLRDQANTTVLQAEVEQIDVDARTVTIDDDRTLGYDFLIVATGARHAYFGNDDWEAHAPGLKTIEDAVDMRQRFLSAFERAERTLDPAERTAELTFVVVGGGPTGVELAGAIPGIVRGGLAKDFRNIDTRTSRVLLVEAGPRLLPAFHEDLSRSAKRDLEKLGVEVRLGVPATHIDDACVKIGDERIATRTVFWAAGNVASPLGRMLDAEVNRTGRVTVAPDCSLPKHPEVFVVGDLCGLLGANGRPLPEVAPTANQTGHHAARMIINTIAGKPRSPYRHFDKGALATIGRHKAVLEFRGIRMSGYIAWFSWLFIHLIYLAGFRNRVSVLLQWAYAYVTYQRGVRLIAGTWKRPPSSVTHVAGNIGATRTPTGTPAQADPQLSPVAPARYPT